MAKKNKPKRRFKIINSIAIVFLSLIIVGSIGGFVLLNNILAESQEFNKDVLDGVEPTILLDSDGVSFKELSTEDGVRENVQYEDLPQVVIDAFLAVEDSRYFKHNGFDLPRFVKSAMENLRAGGFAQGGSTLTMQMIDVTHVTTTEHQNAIEKVFAKIQEIFLAMDAESSLSKKDIMMKYLNYINFGGPARGIQKGALYYFGKDVTQLNLSEAAFLAGVINAPNGYNPYYNYENAVNRRNTSLYLMLSHGYITQSEYDLAIETELAFQLNGATQFETSPYLSYIDQVKDEVFELTGLNIYDGNLIIHTYMDREAQDLADAILNGEGGVTFPEHDELFQTGFALVDNETLGIIALGGGRGYDGDQRINRATTQMKQTGSSIKPIMDYCLTFDYLGWATDHILADIPMHYSGTEIEIGNADGEYRGDVTFVDAVANSWNTTAIQALTDVADTIGVERIISHMQALGFKKFNPSYNDHPIIHKDQFQAGMGIGGSEMVSNPLEMAGAYAMFANEGNYTKPHTVYKIEFRDGSREPIIPVYESVSVISPQAAYLMSTILEDSVSQRYANLQQIMKSDYEVYAKTGTSDWADDGLEYDIPKTAMKDKWLISYTSKYTVSAWAGYDVPVKGMNTYFDNTKMLLNVPGQICRTLFDLVHTDNFPEAIQQPAGVVSITHVKGAFDGGYFAVPEGATEEMTTTGLIKSDFATLKTLEPDPVERLDSFEAKVNKRTGLVEVEFTVYPNEEATVPFDGKYHGIEDFPEFEGIKIFSPAALFGPIVYRVEVVQNHVSLGKFDFAQPEGSSIFNLSKRYDAELCGSYAYRFTGQSSNSICVVLEKDDLKNLDENATPDVGYGPIVDGPDSPLNPSDPTDGPNDGPAGPWEDDYYDNPDNQEDPTVDPSEPEQPNTPSGPIVGPPGSGSQDNPGTPGGPGNPDGPSNPDEPQDPTDE